MLSAREIRIIIDSREQLPYRFDGAITKALPTADYSVEGFSDRIAIERKSLSDLLGCIGGERRRFQAELGRLAQIRYRALVVEAGLSDLLTPGRSEIHPSAVLGSLVAWSWRYSLPIWFADNRRLAQMVTERLLTKAAKYADGEIVNE
jgi:DNA excision repair protein ERCC-4